jgi:hypothetical protein
MLTGGQAAVSASSSSAAAAASDAGFVAPDLTSTLVFCPPSFSPTAPAAGSVVPGVTSTLAACPPSSFPSATSALVISTAGTIDDLPTVEGLALPEREYRNRIYELGEEAPTASLFAFASTNTADYNHRQILTAAGRSRLRQTPVTRARI